eukprot:CAMPEP_0194369594 /NCGR_PEP_ID=MMETSP0174-20130528/17914_1 /TAXON_ID=216777 /ORGANISM="Proboscia alata, Strain PI-D3" /LENGTH=481 /DNA_ID=CAMNT_0039146637 /DNA_START=45 /DNA_END=1490 /DNA_ORIENTATION=-
MSILHPRSNVVYRWLKRRVVTGCLERRKKLVPNTIRKVVLYLVFPILFWLLLWKQFTALMTFETYDEYVSADETLIMSLFIGKSNNINYSHGGNLLVSSFPDNTNTTEISWKSMTNFNNKSDTTAYSSADETISTTGSIDTNYTTTHNTNMTKVGSSNMLLTSKHKHTSATERRNQTKILGFSDFGYKEIAVRWYTELSQLGYTEHVIVALDDETVEYLKAKNNALGGIRYDRLHQNSSSLVAICESDRRYQAMSVGRQDQRIRRRMFGSRWHYVLAQLEAGFHVLLTDVDNVFNFHKPLSEMEESTYDVYHAYAGTIDTFPRNLYKIMGFTVCGGMSWLRSTPGVIDYVRAITAKCGCLQLDCNCYCDDQVVLNNYVYQHYVWDRKTVTVPWLLKEMQWEGYTGYSNATNGHRVKIWDRDVAYRAEFDEELCPDSVRNWIAMPIGLDKPEIWDIWQNTCGKTNTTTHNLNLSSSTTSETY